MSRQLFINNADAVPGADTTAVNPADIAEARFAIFDADNFAGGTLDPTAATSAKRVQFVQGGQGDNDAIISSIIDVDDVKDVVEVDYIAPVAQVTTVTPEVGTGFATIRVVRADGNPRPHERKTAEVKIDDLTATEIAQAFADQLNEQFPDFVTASVSGSDLVLTGAIDYQDASGQNGIVSFETSTDGEAEGWTVAATTTPNAGSGAGWQVEELEEIAYGGDYTNRIYLPVKPPKYADPASNYKLITVRVRTNTTENIAKSNKYQELMIAVVTGGTADGIDLATFFGV